MNREAGRPLLFELDFTDRRWRILTRQAAAQVLREARAEGTCLRDPEPHVYAIFERSAAATLRPVA